jgi:serine protease Do
MNQAWTRLLFGIGCGLALLLPALASAQEYDPSLAVSRATAIVRPSVVAIETQFDQPRIDDNYAFWHALRGPRPLYGLWGSGFIYKDPQYVITSDFLMDYAKYIRIILDDGRSYSAEMVGKDSDFGVAILKVDWGPDIEPIAPPFGNSDDLKLGTPIALVGKALNSIDTYATAGIISAIRKEIPNSNEPTDQFLQFDASWELSFIGGPIVDVNGNVVGMIGNSAGNSLNLGAPINDVVEAVQRILSGEDTKIWFGVEGMLMASGIMDIGEAPRTFDWNGDGKAEPLEFGRWVSYVEPNSPADIAGLRPSDTIVELNGKLIKYSYDWSSTIRTFRVGQLVTVAFIRKNKDTGEWERQQTQVQILASPDAEEKVDKAKSKDRRGAAMLAE